MQLDEYQELASRTSLFSHGHYVSTASPDCVAWNALGLTGEAGEVADMIKKVVMHGHPMDYEKLKKELGDCLWYVAQLASMMGWQLSEVAERNIEKLKQRYPDGFSSEASKNRKTEEGEGK